MSYYAANSGQPSNFQRSQEDAYWRAANRGNQGLSQSNGHMPGGQIGSKITDYFSGGKDLPLYKDKPQPHYGSRRRRGFLWSKKTLGVICLGLLALFWWLRPISSPMSGHEGVWKGGDILEGLSKADKPSKTPDWSLRRDLVKEAFITTWDSYSTYAWGMDEFHPISKKGRNMVEGGLGWIIVDALDTAMLMNLTAQVKHAREWIATSLHYTADHEVNTFETTIRMLGGLLSAHYLSTTYPSLAPQVDDDVNQPGEDLYIEKATDLADRLLGAFDSQSGIAYASINLNTSVGSGSNFDMGASSTAEAATLQLELKYLAKLTGEPHYWIKAEKAMEVIDNNHPPGGLVPIFIYPNTGAFRGDNIRLGSRGDSYYEYLIKQYLQTGGAETVYLDMWNEALAGVKKYLITYTKHANLTVLAERQDGLDKLLAPKMDHLVCFMPGTIALAVTGGLTLLEAKKRHGWTARQEEDMHLARELMKTCWAMYKGTATGLAPEITYFEIDDPPRMYEDYKPTEVVGRFPPDVSTKDHHRNKNKNTNTKDHHDDDEWAQDHAWRRDIDIHSNDVHNLQRPETVESLFYMYRITQDTMYREWGWEMFRSFVRHTAVVGGSGSRASDEKGGKKVYAFTSLDDVQPLSRDPTADHKGQEREPTDEDDDADDDDADDKSDSANAVRETRKRDNVESFWLAETLKYFYLLFSDDDEQVLPPLKDVVWNTEAHVFPRFEMGRVFATGWERKTPKKDKDKDTGKGEAEKDKSKGDMEGEGKREGERKVKLEEVEVPGEGKGDAI